MLRKERPVDPDFDGAERLFWRCLEKDVPGGRLTVEAFRFPDFSVNREKYSEPEDVLIPDWPDWGIVAFKVADIPEPITTEGGATYSFHVAHDPEDENYAHSEVRTHKNGVFDRDLSPAKSVKKMFRLHLSERALVLRMPQSTATPG